MRPISPYLSVYKPQIGSIFSIFGRITGVYLTLIFVIYLLLLFLYQSYLSYYIFYSFCYFFFYSSNELGGIFIIFFLINFIYHILFSFRYLYWSYSGGASEFLLLSLENIYRIAFSVCCALFIFVILFWFLL